MLLPRPRDEAWVPLKRHREVLGVELLNGEPMRQHIDDLGYPDTRAFNGQFAARPFGLRFKVFHSISIVARIPVKVNLINYL